VLLTPSGFESFEDLEAAFVYGSFLGSVVDSVRF